MSSASQFVFILLDNNQKEMRILRATFQDSFHVLRTLEKVPGSHFESISDGARGSHGKPNHWAHSVLDRGIPGLFIISLCCVENTLL